MGYQFKGLFSNGDATVMEAILDQWPMCEGKIITEPFGGFGIRFPDPDRETDSDDDYEAMSKALFAFEQVVQDLSSIFPGLVFVYVHADCFGGTCVYQGVVASDGEIQEIVDSAEPGTGNLKKMLAPLGVQSVHPFPPFVRGYWEEQGTRATARDSGIRSRKTVLLLALLAVTAGCSALGVFAPEGSWNELLLTLGQIVVTPFLLLLWCHFDSVERGYQLSTGLSILIILAALIGLPIYFLRSRGTRWGLLATLKAAAFLGLLCVVGLLSAEAAYLAASR